MKPRPSRIPLLATSLFATLSPVNGNSIIWDGSESIAWATGTNWTGNIAPANDLVTDIALFNLAANPFQPNAGTTSVAGIQIGDGATATGALTLGGASLTVGSSGISMLANAGAVSINAPITLGNSQIWTNNSANLLTFGGTVTSAAAVTQTLTVGGTGNTTINGLLNDGATGTLNLTKSGAGYLKLNGAATNIAGTLDIQGGTVGVVNDVVATGLTGTGTFENTTNADKWTTWNIGSTQTFDGVFRNNNGVSTGLLGFIKQGAGTLTLTNSLSNQSSNLSVDAGKLVLNNTGSFGAGNQGGATRTNLATWIGSVAAANGVLEINGATVNYNNRSGTGTEVWLSTLNVGSNATGAGSLKMTSGSLSTNKQLALSSTNGAYGAMTQTGGTTNVGGFLAVALGGANARGVLNVSGGNFNQAGPVTLGAAGIGVMNLSGSAIYNQNSTGDNGLWVGEAGTGVMNVSGNASLSIVSDNNGLQLGRGASGVGTANLLGGTVTAKAIYKGAGIGTLNFNGGTLAANVDNGSFLNGLTNAYVHSGGGTINNGGNDIAIGQSLLVPTDNGVSASGLTVGGSGFINTPVVTITGGDGSGATAVATIDESGNLTGITMTSPGNGYTTVPTFTLSGGGIGNTGSIIGAATLVANTSGGMEFSGAGTTTVSGANTYTGLTILSGGTLNLIGSISDSPMTIGAATLSGTGYAGAVTVVDTGAIVSNGNNGNNLLTLDSLTFNASASVNLSLSGFPVAVVSVTNDLNIGTGFTINILSGPAWTNGETYNVMGYGGLNGSSFNIVKGTIPGLGARQSATIGNTGASNGFITLAIDGDTPVWTGIQSGAWTTAAIGGTKNWKLQTGGTLTDFITNDHVLFDDSATGTTDVNIADADVQVASVIFANESLDYTISSTGGFGIADGASPAGLTKSGAATVTLTTTNSYTGTTTIDGGTLRLGNGTIDGDISSSSAIVNNATLTFSRNAGSFTNGNAISGFGAVVKDGAGTQILTGTNSYSGTTTINAGTLQVGDGGATGSLGAGLVTNNASLVFNRSGALVVDGQIEGTGSVTQAGTGDLTLSVANTYSGGTLVTSGTLIPRNADALGTNTLTLDGGHLRGGAPSGTTIGNNIVVNGTAGFTTAANLTISGTITGSGTLDNGVATGGASLSIVGDLSGFTGTFAHTTSNSHNNFNLGGGTAASMDASQAKLVLSGGTTEARNVNINGTGTPVFKIGDLSGAGGKINTNNGTTLQVGALGLNSTFAGNISSIGGIEKVGSGTWTLTGTNTYTGATTVAAGVLAVDGDAIPNAGKLVIAAGGQVNPMGATEFVDTLFFGDEQQLDGTYGAIGSGADHEDDTYFTGTGVVSVTTGPPSGYSDWADLYAPGQAMDLDHDGDGVENGIEYFMGEMGSTFTANPAEVGGSVTWTMGDTYAGVYGTDYEVQSSTDLAVWTKVEIGTGDNTVTVNPGTSVVYNMPTGGSCFVRLVVKN